jgi:hypothetical protein
MGRRGGGGLGKVTTVRVLLALASASCLSRDAIAGAWTQPENGGYAKLWARWQAADGPFDKYIDAERNKHSLGGYNELSLQAYVEYGFKDGITGVFVLPLVRSFLLSAPNSYSAVTLGDPSAGARIRLYEGVITVAAQLLVTVPIASSSPQIAVVDPDTHQVFAHLRIGQGVFDLEPRLQVGKGFSWGHLGAEIGYQARTGGYRHRIVSMVEGSLKLSDAWRVTVRAIDLALVGPTSAPYDESLSGIGNGTAYFGVSAEIDWRIGDHLSIGTVYETAVYEIRQAGGPVINAYAAWVF